MAHLVLIGILAGCGGTPAGESSGAAPVPGTPQRPAAIAVVSTNPANAAVNVSAATTVHATFATAVNSASLSDATFTLRDSKGAVGGAVSYSGTTATFTPARNLSPATPYTATVSATVTDASGRPMGADYSWSFTTRDRTWGSAQFIETNNAGAFSPQVAVDPSGNGLAVWSQSDGTGSNIWANRFSAAASWGAAQPIGTNTGGNASEPHVAVDPSGNALAVWLQVDGIRYDMWANRFTPAAGWGTAELIGTNTGGVFSPQVVVDPSGNALAVWIQFDGTGSNMWATRFTPATGWGAAQPIGTNTGGALSPQVSVDSGGNALAVWLQSDGVFRSDGPSYNSIWANRFTPATGWGTAQLIETDPNSDASEPHVAVDPSGNALAVWYQIILLPTGTRRDIWANRFTSATGWGTAQLIETNNAGDAYEPQVAVDPSGNALAVWFQFDGTRSNIWANRFTPATGWGAAQLIETDDTGAFGPHVGVDSSGNALAVWFQFDGTRSNIWANRFTPATGWGTAQLVQTDNVGSPFLRPRLAVDSSGNALAVWNQFDGVRYNILANRFE